MLKAVNFVSFALAYPVRVCSSLGMLKIGSQTDYITHVFLFLPLFSQEVENVKEIFGYVVILFQKKYITCKCQLNIVISVDITTLQFQLQDTRHGLFGIVSSFIENTSPLLEKVFLQDGANFHTNPVTKPVVIQATTRHQMKDKDTIFPLITLSFL